MHPPAPIIGSIITAASFEPNARILFAACSPTPTQHKIYELIHLEMMHLGQFYARRGMINLSLPVTAEMCEVFCTALINTLERFGSEITDALAP